MANLLTGLRIACAFVLLFCTPFSLEFYVLYLIAGLTDMLDGPIARKTNSASEFGAKFDSFADLIFVIVCLVKLVPVLNIEIWVFIWVVAIATIKFFNIIINFALNKEFLHNHSTLNKITGIMIFILPLTINLIDLNISAFVVCTIASIAAIYELYLIGFLDPKNTRSIV